MDVAAVVDEVRRRGGVSRRADLPRRATDRALAAGRLVSPRRGIVADPALPSALLTALGCGGVLSCASAAQLHGLDLLDEPVVPHVTVRREQATRPSPGLVVHRRDVPREGVVTTLSRTAADCARCLPERDAVVVLDSALRRGVGAEEIGQHLWGRGCGAARAALRRADGRSGSSGETCARLALEDAGLSVEPQVLIGGVGWVDLVVEGRVVVEIDGFAYHSDPARFAHDRRRDAELTALGYRVLRFTWLDAVRRPDRVVAVVRRVLAVSA